ncbi:TRAP transporter permease [Aeromicrobium ponti]|uniref:TRAP transporter 4TM/12TM fusion protein n=1 Tax=Cytobacillus oceanisediminis TaxID=665099 RepID=A0A562JRW4_9BACI|nr:TRAP transporter permease [Cytobacillus oceanisediminis]TWH85927.1 TRAP transporter 4TM/12TM fusion protein [Cytobacillus oceanisediminis]
MMSERLNKLLKTIVVIATLIGILLSINMLFYLELFGFNPLQNSYLYYILACFMPIAFLIFPAKKGQKVKWYDFIFASVSFAIVIYFGLNGQRMIMEGWDWNAPPLATYSSIILWGLLLEALRRTGGLVLSIICLLISLYPLIASGMPIGFLQGQSYDLFTIARNHMMSANGVLGIALTTVGNLILGFLVFGVVLTHTGGGDFFFKLAQSMFGRFRGGEAKVSIVSSAFFGMLSGSAISNTITTGAMTIPAMKKSGYKPHYAGAIEAVASTGGTITPPIMGSAAFIMASFLAIPYYEIALAAAIPALLYYIGLIVQADGYAAKNNLKGLKKEEIPSFLETLKGGWYYLFALVLLVYFLVILNSEGQAPYYASLVLLIIAMINKTTRMNVKQLFDMFVEIGKVLTEIVCIIAGVGFIVGALSATGVSFSFSRELVAAAGDSMILILIGGALTSFILGMGMTVSAVYVFLAIIMAPALVAIGVDPVAAHLFVVYWATVSYITPPVALAAFAASGIAKANPMKTGFTAVRLGAVTFLVPFFFVYQPALIFRGEPLEIALSVVSAIIGVFLLSSSLEGYLIGFGRMQNLLVRLIVLVAGLCMLIPGILTDALGIALALIIYVPKFLKPVNVNIDEKQEV